MHNIDAFKHISNIGLEKKFKKENCAVKRQSNPYLIHLACEERMSDSLAKEVTDNRGKRELTCLYETHLSKFHFD